LYPREKYDKIKALKLGSKERRTKIVSVETNSVHRELKSRKEKVVKQLTIHKYLHIQFIKLGFVVGVALVLLGAFAAFEGIKLTQYEAGKYKTSQGFQIAITIALVSVVVIAIIVLIDRVLSRVVKKILLRIGEPVQIMDEVMSNLANGKLEDDFSYDMEDEFSNMVSNAGSAVRELKKYIDNITDTLHQMEERNMDVTVDQEYIGDFAEIRTSLLSIIDSLNVTLYEMRASFMQVRDGADSLAETAQSMADGAEQQSVHIKGMVDQIEEVADSVHNNTIAAQDVERLSKDSMEKMAEGEKKMDELSQAMDQIRMESNEIASIIEVITGIAAQTNLLALNASIEAARAGEHGKGFAVVASEIGGLAGSSAQASQNITELIQKSIAAVNNGVTITGETVEMMEGISKISSEISQNISRITDTSRKQDDSLKNMLDSANEIAAVIDQNTAAAEESSALSEELLGYTENVMVQIEKYKIKEN
jgi:methyl-accepting chemotaxis protein